MEIDINNYGILCVWENKRRVFIILGIPAKNSLAKLDCILTVSTRGKSTWP